MRVVAHECLFTRVQGSLPQSTRRYHGSVSPSLRISRLVIETALRRADFARTQVESPQGYPLTV